MIASQSDLQGAQVLQVQILQEIWIASSLIYRMPHFVARHSTIARDQDIFPDELSGTWNCLLRLLNSAVNCKGAPIHLQDL